MKRRAILALCAALAIAACTFSSERPLFSQRDGSTAFAEGRYTWRDDDGEAMIVELRRSGRAYVMRPVEESGEKAMEVLFAPVRSTPEEDYIAQVKLEADSEMRAYAFMWPEGAGHRVITAPSELEDASGGVAALAARCASRPGNECQVTRREDLLALYTEIVYPAFVTGDRTPDDYMDLIPVQ